MARHLRPTTALLALFPGIADVLALDAQSDEGKKVREVVKGVGHIGPLYCEQPYPHEEVAGGRTARAGQILRNAIERYRQPDGYEGVLVESAWECEQIGAEAWQALRELVLEGAPECEYFLGAVVRLEGVAPEHRLPILLSAARIPDANVRSRMLELLEEMPGELRREVLLELTGKDRPDDDVTDRALEICHDQAS